MKHIFYIQSPITFLITKSIIAKNNLKKDEIVFFVKSHYKAINTELKDCFDFEGEFRKLLIPKSFASTIINDKNQYKKIDALINNLIGGEKFNIYIPNIYSPERQVLINHPNCIQVNFIEEGLMAYSYSDSYKNDFFGNLKGLKKITALYSRLLFSLGRRRQFAPINFFDTSVVNKKKPINYYGLSKLSFTKYTQKNRIIIPMASLTGNKKIPSGSILIVLDTILENNIVEEENFYNSLRIMMDNLPKPFYIKFHPLQSKSVVNYVKDYCLKWHFKFYIVDGNTPMEEYLINSDKLNIYGYISSLLFYAKLFKNHNVTSYMSDFEYDKKYLNYQLTQDFDLNELLEKISK